MKTQQKMDIEKSTASEEQEPKKKKKMKAD